MSSVTAFAQTPPPCPPAPPPMSKFYTESYCQDFFLSTGCKVNICWCQRTIGDYPDIAITSITTTPGPACDNMSWHDIVIESNTKLLQQLMGLTSPGNCDSTGGKDTISVSMGVCYFASTTYDAYKLSMCNNGGWCQTIYTVCMNQGAKWIAAVNHNYITGDCSTPAPADGHWTMGQCYLLFSACP